jgi:S-adenosylmethionine/arginine decarboxylase-like enzyme
VDSKIGVVIIALDSLSPRISLLVSELRTRGLDDVHVLPAVTPREVANFQSNSADGSLIANISPIEQAISHSHHQARIFAKQNGWGWALILEEDAVVIGTPDSLNLMIQEIENLQTNSSHIAIHLFPEQHGLLGHSTANNLCKIYWVPDYAVGYLLNSEALQKSTELFSTQKTQVADWPDFMRSLEWWAPNRSWVCHPLVSEEISATQKSRKSIQLSISLVRKMVSRGYWIGFVLPFFSKIFHVYGANEIPDENLRSVLVTNPRFLRRWI